MPPTTTKAASLADGPEALIVEERAELAIVASGLRKLPGSLRRRLGTGLGVSEFRRPTSTAGRGGSPT